MNTISISSEVRMDTVSIGRFRVVTSSQDSVYAEMLSVTQFADQAGVTPQGVRKMISEGRLNAVKIGEQHIILKSELERYLGER